MASEDSISRPKRARDSVDLILKHKMAKLAAFDVLTECSLCNTDLRNTPTKTLDCLHCYCSSCFEKSFSSEGNNGDATLQCPICENGDVEMTDEAQTSDGSQKNTFDLKILQARNLLESGQTCELCAEESGGTLSAHWCHDCSKFLCTGCEVWHRRLRPNDNVIDLSNGEGKKLENFLSPTMCASHNKRYKVYCGHCDVCLCSSCLLEHCSGEKACSRAVAVETQAPSVREEGQEILNKIALLSKTIEEQGEAMTTLINLKVTQCSEKKDHIRQHAEEFISTLRANTEAFIADMEKMTQTNIGKIEELISLKKNHLSQLEILANDIQQLLKLADNVDVLLYFPQLRSRYESLDTRQMDRAQWQYHVLVEYNTLFIKMFQMLKDISVGGCRLEHVRNIPDMLPSLGETLLAKCTEDFTHQFPIGPPRLVDTGRIMSEKMERMITAVLVTEDDHVLVSDFFGKDLREYGKEDNLLYSFKPEGMESPLDMCPFSEVIIGVVAGSHELYLLERNKDTPALTLLKHIKTEKKYTSLCNCFGKILSLDKFGIVEHLSPEGEVLKTILSSQRKWSCNHRIARGPRPGTFLLLDFVVEKIYCYNLDGKLLSTFNADPGKETSDICTDRNGNVYICSRQDLYMIDKTQKRKLLDFGKKLSQWPRMCIKDGKLYISVFTEEQNAVKIYNIA